MDGENHGKHPIKKWDDLGGFPPLFSDLHPFQKKKSRSMIFLFRCLCSKFDMFFCKTSNLPMRNEKKGIIKYDTNPSNALLEGNPVKLPIDLHQIGYHPPPQKKKRYIGNILTPVKPGSLQLKMVIIAYIYIYIYPSSNNS